MEASGLSSKLCDLCALCGKTVSPQISADFRKKRGLHVSPGIQNRKSAIKNPNCLTPSGLVVRATFACGIGGCHQRAEDKMAGAGIGHARGYDLPSWGSAFPDGALFHTKLQRGRLEPP